MGFRTNSFCTVWEVESVSDVVTKARITTSRKNRQTGENETDFSGFVSFIGTAAAKKALGLKEKSRIRLKDVDVTNKYDKEKKTSYTNFAIFSFETQDEIYAETAESDGLTPKTPVDEGEIDDSRLPF